jgi:hypothetical protein
MTGKNFRRKAMLLTNGSATFPRLKGAAQPAQVVTVSFASAVSRATAILTGFTVKFSPDDGDHHLGQLDVRTVAGVPISAGLAVPVTVFFDLRDWSGNHDDAYEGQVFFTVVAE